jgi:hypothetical protein
MAMGNAPRGSVQAYDTPSGLQTGGRKCCTNSAWPPIPSVAYEGL